MKTFIVIIPNGENLLIEADYFKVSDGAVHFFKDAEELTDVFVSSHGTIVLAEEKMKRVKGFE
ncbi:MAG TPA: hypothetical protein VKA34_23755 [Balneolales bacterium]|nr:hypothetical protein [Balneolales bacterium]